MTKSILFVSLGFFFLFPMMQSMDEARIQNVEEPMRQSMEEPLIQNVEPAPMNQIKDLAPIHLWQSKIFTYLSLRDLCTCAKTWKRWNEICSQHDQIKIWSPGFNIGNCCRIGFWTMTIPIFGGKPIKKWGFGKAKKHTMTVPTSLAICGRERIPIGISKHLPYLLDQSHTNLENLQIHKIKNGADRTWTFTTRNLQNEIVRWKYDNPSFPHGSFMVYANDWSIIHPVGVVDGKLSRGLAGYPFNKERSEQIVFRSRHVGYIKTIIPNDGAYAALSNKGDVFVWGSSQHGAREGGYLWIMEDKVKTIVSTSQSFAALLKSGNVFVWGGQDGCVPSYPIKNQLKNVKEIVSTHKAFSALTNQGTVVVWGQIEYGGGSMNKNLNYEIKSIYSNLCAFAGLRQDHSVVTWGNPDCGGYLDAPLNYVEMIFSTNQAFAALDWAGKVTTWGHGEFGAEIPYDTQQELDVHRVNMIFSNAGAFVALTHSAHVITWGKAEFGGQMNDDIREKLNAKKVTTIVPMDKGFYAKMEDGKEIQW